MRFKLCTQSIVLVSLLAPVVTSAQQPSWTANDLHYSFTDLGTPLGGSFADAVGIGNRGVFFGYGNLPGDVVQHALVFKDGAARDLGTFGGTDSAFLGNSSGFAESSRLDPLGQDFCHYGTGQICTAMTIRDGALVPLPALGGYSSAAFGNNDWGQVVGTAQTATPDPDCLVNGPSSGLNLQFLPVKWTFGKPKALALAPGDSIGHAYAINIFGQAVGATGICVSNEDAHALLWDGSRTIDLGNLGGSMGNQPDSINDQGEVTGTSDLPGDLTNHAFLWRHGKMLDIGTLPGDYFSYGNSINNRSQIAGQSCDANFNCKAILWEKGTMTDLNTLLPSTSTLLLVSANAISDDGQIAGYAYDSATNTYPAFSAQLQRGKCDAAPTLRNLRLSQGNQASGALRGMTRHPHRGPQ